MQYHRALKTPTCPSPLAALLFPPILLQFPFRQRCLVIVSFCVILSLSLILPFVFGRSLLTDCIVQPRSRGANHGGRLFRASLFLYSSPTNKPTCSSLVSYGKTIPKNAYAQFKEAVQCKCFYHAVVYEI